MPNSNDFSPEMQEELDRLAAMPDEEIDLSDIPELSEEAWANARRPGLHRPVKESVTLSLDVDVVAWFKERATDGGYETEINRVLRRHVAEARG